ncbi:hypothetical protein, partial [Actinopolyspora erythraea]|uniref:hypothetical protein n=1 Tax=Actinopolyspora erythraea TaxID=414996 RepID=UPI0005B813B3
MSTEQSKRWAGHGWQIDVTDTQTITVSAPSALPPADAREMASALQHAAYTTDGDLTEHDWTHA